jgi:Bacterial Ig-like domain
VLGLDGPQSTVKGDYFHSDPNYALYISSAGNTIGGVNASDRNVISSDGEEGIILFGNSNLIEGNYIGTDQAGMAAGRTQAAGINSIKTTVSNNTIGGTSAGARNVISGNTEIGVFLYGGKSNLIEGNFIGVDATGKNALGNGGAANSAGIGLFIASGSANTIGGTIAGAANVVSANAGSGIEDDASAEVIAGNLIGTDSTGMRALGNDAGNNGFAALSIGGSGDTIGGTTSAARNVISGNLDDALQISPFSGAGAGGQLVEGNYIGTDIKGTTALANGTPGTFGGTGLVITGQGNTIGGTTSAARNVIAGNMGEGIDLGSFGTSASANLVEGNFIGIDANGSSALPNGTAAAQFSSGAGILIQYGSQSNTIGGSLTAAANVISGNAGDGIDISDSGTNQNVVLGNVIGTEAAGKTAVANQGDGILIENGAQNDSIGGTVRGAGNIIAGNRRDGIEVQGPSTSKIMIAGNIIGTDSTHQLQTIGNADFGIKIGSGATMTIVGHALTDQITPGTPQNPDPAANVIAYNGTSFASGAAVVIEDDDTAGNSIRGNSIFGNGPVPSGDDGYTYNSGIDLGADGRTLNTNPQPSDSSGPNGSQNFPISTMVKPDGGGLEVIGTLNSLPNASFTLDFYGNDGSALEDVRQGQTYLGSTTVTTDEAGFGTFDVTLNGVGAGATITATASGTAGTSEFEFMYTRPILIVPGIVGSLPDQADFAAWLVHRGFDPEALVADPLTNVYGDIIQTLENEGYILNETLFVANYDWRVEIAPPDFSGYNCTIPGLTADVISSNLNGDQFNYGVDYLAYWMRKASLAFNQDLPDIPLDSVDVIAHSMGGLIARAYIQSPAYGAMAGWGVATTTKFPTINSFIMEATPNRGAPLAFNPLQDNWNSNDVFRLIFSRMLLMAYNKLLGGATVVGPNADQNFSLQDVLNKDGSLNYQAFIGLYVPTIYSLMSTEAFFSAGPGQPLVDLNSNPAYSNTLLLDLNGGDGLSTFTTMVQHVTVIYGTGVPTVTSTVQTTGPIIDRLFFVPVARRTLFPFRNNFPWPIAPGGDQVWFNDQTEDTGDDTVPVSSSVGPFQNADNVTKFEIDGATHGGIIGNSDSQKEALQVLGFDLSNGAPISTGLGRSQLLENGYWRIVVTWDPVGAVLTDSKGQRLGYTTETGPLAEIPGSVFLGDATAGFGLAFGDGPPPSQLTLSGMGGSFSVYVDGEAGTEDFGVTSTGTLGVGQTQSVPLSFAAPDPPSLLPADSNGSPDGETTTSVSPRLVGMAMPDAKVQLESASGTIMASTQADDTGAYEFTVPGPLALGTYSFRVTVSDQYGDTSLPSAPQSIMVVAASSSPPLHVTPPLVTLTGVREITSRKHQVTKIVLTFSGALSSFGAQLLRAYRLVTAGKGGSFTARNAQAIRLKSAVYDPIGHRVTLVPKKAFGLTKPVQLRIDGTDSAGLRDSVGRLIDGDHNGTAGGDAIAVLRRSGVTISAITQAGQGRAVAAVVDALLERDDLVPRRTDLAFPSGVARTSRREWRW